MCSVIGQVDAGADDASVHSMASAGPGDDVSGAPQTQLTPSLAAHLVALC